MVVWPGGLRTEKVRDGAGARRLSKDGNAIRIATKCADVGVRPAQRLYTVEKAPVASRGAERVARSKDIVAQEAKSAQSIWRRGARTHACVSWCHGKGGERDGGRARGFEAHIYMQLIVTMTTS